MGGNAFPKLVGTRLTTPQLDTLLSYVTSRLTPQPFSTTTTFRFPQSKLSHGDLDVLCAWSEGVVGVYPKGQEMLVLDYRNEEADQRQGLAGLMVRLAKMLGGREIRRAGFECSVRVPCWRVIPEMFDEMEFGPEEPFYQVDLLLLPPDSIEFASLTTSYGLNLLIISAALRILSPSLTLHMDCLTIRYLPYPGLQPIIVQLTHSASDLCEWLGLNYKLWLETDFETDEKGFEWMVDVNEDSILAEGWRRMSKRGAIKQVGHTGKAGGLNLFRDWLQKESKWKITKPEGEGEEPSTPERKAVLDGVSVPDLMLSPSTVTNTTTQSIDANMIDPDHPHELNQKARDALMYWGKSGEWDRAMEVKKGDAKIRSDAQRKKIDSRRRALLNTLDEERGFEELGKGLGGLAME